MTKKNLISRILILLVAVTHSEFAGRGASGGSRSRFEVRHAHRPRLPTCSTSTLQPRINWMRFRVSVRPIRRRSSTAVPTRPRPIWSARRSFPKRPTTRSKTRSSQNRSKNRGAETSTILQPFIPPFSVRSPERSTRMGLLDNLESMAVGKVAGRNPQAAAILQMIQNHPGGISGLVQAFQSNGLGGLVNSWISTGQNQPVSSGSDPASAGIRAQCRHLAQKLGISPDAGEFHLVAMLPTVVDKLTPNGSVPDHSNLVADGREHSRVIRQDWHRPASLDAICGQYAREVSDVELSGFPSIAFPPLVEHNRNWLPAGHRSLP